MAAEQGICHRYRCNQRGVDNPGAHFGELGRLLRVRPRPYRYRLADDDAIHANLVERLGDAGCNDALGGIGQPGYIALELTREAGNALAAEPSAIADVKRAIPSAPLIEAIPAISGEPRDYA